MVQRHLFCFVLQIFFFTNSFLKHGYRASDHFLEDACRQTINRYSRWISLWRNYFWTILINWSTAAFAREPETGFLCGKMKTPQQGNNQQTSVTFQQYSLLIIRYLTYIEVTIATSVFWWCNSSVLASRREVRKVSAALHINDWRSIHKKMMSSVLWSLTIKSVKVDQKHLNLSHTLTRCIHLAGNWRTKPGCWWCPLLCHSNNSHVKTCIISQSQNVSYAQISTNKKTTLYDLHQYNHDVTWRSRLPPRGRQEKQYNLLCCCAPLDKTSHTTIQYTHQSPA